MKSVRLLAGMLLLISGILHIVAYFKAPESQGSIPVLAFGVIYMIVGLLLFNGKQYPLYLAYNCSGNRDDTFTDKIRNTRIDILVSLI